MGNVNRSPAVGTYEQLAIVVTKPVAVKALPETQTPRLQHNNTFSMTFQANQSPKPMRPQYESIDH